MLRDEVITEENIFEYNVTFTSWKNNLSQDADILFYGCSIAKEETGKNVINDISEWTGADDTASTNRTGSSINNEVGTLTINNVTVSNSIAFLGGGNSKCR